MSLEYSPVFYAPPPFCLMRIAHHYAPLFLQDHYLPVEDDEDDWAAGPEYQRRVCLTRGDLGLGIEVCGDEVREGFVCLRVVSVCVRVCVCVCVCV